MRIILLFIGIAFLLFIFACPTSQQDHLLVDFESNNELDRFEWKCKTLFSLSSEHVTHGRHSLKLELFPSDYPGIAPILVRKNWRNYRNFAFDVFNTMGENVVLSVRIDDPAGYKDDAERYNHNFNLNPGMNHLRIPLSSIRASGTHRPLNLKTIRNLTLFVDSPKEKIVIYTDFWRLER